MVLPHELSLRTMTSLEKFEEIRNCEHGVATRLTVCLSLSLYVCLSLAVSISLCLFLFVVLVPVYPSLCVDLSFPVGSFYVSPTSFHLCPCAHAYISLSISVSSVSVVVPACLWSCITVTPPFCSSSSRVRKIGT